VYYATRAELAAVSDRDCAGTRSVTGSVSGMTAGQSTRVALGAAVSTPTQASPGVSLTSVAGRSLDLVATKGVITTTQFNIQSAPDALLLQRGVDAAAATVGTLDFGAQGFAPTQTNLTLANTAVGDNLNVATTFWSATSTYGLIHAFQPTTTTNTLYSMPAARFAAGDVQELFVETFQNGFVSGRVNAAYVAGIVDRTETLPPNLTTPAVNVVASSPSIRFRAQLPAQAEYSTAARFIFCQDCGASTERDVYLIVSAGFLGGAPTTWDVAIPDFGSVAGLNASWLLSTALLVYQAEAHGGPALVVFGSVPAIGDVYRAAYRIVSTGSLLRAAESGPHLRRAGARQYLRR
jgi:hypothetical protein